MRKYFFLLVILANLLIGCKTSFIKPPTNEPSDDATIKLAEAANSVSDSMLEMARVEKYITPPHKDNSLNIPNAHTLQATASVDWSGPIEELTLRIARAADYKLHVLGKAPAIPVLISLTKNNATLGQLLRDIDYQAGVKAYIHVYPNNRIVELRYAKFYS